MSILFAQLKTDKIMQCCLNISDQTDSTLAWLCFPSLANCLIIIKNVDNDIFKTSSPPPLHFVLSNIWLEMLDLFVVISADDPDH